MSKKQTETECPMQNPSNIMESFNEMFGFVQIPHPTILEDMYTGFLLPMDYLEKSQQNIITKNVADDLELIQLIDSSSNNCKKSMYELFAEPSNDFGKLLIPEIAKRYTTNIGFLEDTQKVVERTALSLSQNGDKTLKKSTTERFIEIWKEIKEDRSFLDRHNYMEYVFLEDLNKSNAFLNAYSIMNLISPIYGLVLPLIILLLPFAIIRLWWNLPITFDIYLKTLRDVSKTHYIGRIINIREWNAENIIYVLFIGGMYIMQTYNQVTSCIKYHSAVKRMNENLLFIRDYLDNVILSMDRFIKTNSDLAYYSDFCQDVYSNKIVLQNLREKIGYKITPYGWTMHKMTELGHMFDCYYQLYSCIDYESSLRYSIGFEGYLDIVRGIAKSVLSYNLGKTTFISSINEQDESDENEKLSDENKSNKIKNVFNLQYYPPHKNSNNCVKNTINLCKNIIITGVNASGKTTTLKTTALNIIFSQQFGFGFYESAIITPYNHIHSYLNIPDTSGRDSLFQAESRRCKEILDKIRDASEDEPHFVIFDELYSGTNPKEATKSAHSLLKYLSQKPNVRFVLTTHYINVCRKFRESKTVKNYKMNVEINDNKEFVYTYKMSKGISTLEGGIAILKTMNYPQEIINTIENPI